MRLLLSLPLLIRHQPSAKHRRTCDKTESHDDHHAAVAGLDGLTGHTEHLADRTLRYGFNDLAHELKHNAGAAVVALLLYQGNVVESFLRHSPWGSPQLMGISFPMATALPLVVVSLQVDRLTTWSSAVMPISS